MDKRIILFVVVVLALFAIGMQQKRYQTITYMPIENRIEQKVKCVFHDADGEVSCYPRNIYTPHACEPSNTSCNTTILGQEGYNIIWTSSKVWSMSCGRATSVVSYEPQTIDFWCKGESYNGTPEVIVEKAECFFWYTNNSQQCTPKGVEVISPCEADAKSCSLTIKGMKWDRFTWDSTCGNPIKDTITGAGKGMVFNCTGY